MATPRRKDRGDCVSQAEAGRILGIDPALITRTWKPRFDENDWPGFYPEGVNISEFHSGMLKWERMKAAKVRDSDGESDADDRWKEARADKAQLELQALQGKIIYVPDFVDELVRMQTEYRQSVSRLPRTMAANLTSWIAAQMAEDIQKNPAIGKSLERIKQGELETWMNDRINAAVGDMGKHLDKAWRSSIDRSKIKLG